ncbi:MAG: hypothetical protein M0Z95_09220 [Actinomycetota bacterium]|jgi:hypothetical protein|nr:hypothetical protein [Actinomycetota bacterium]
MVELPDDYLRYKPQANTCPPEVWDVIGSLVFWIASKAEFPKSAYGKRSLTYTTAFVAWCYLRYTTLDIEQIFDPQRVEYYCEHVLDPRTAKTARSALRGIGKAVTVSAPWEKRPRQYPYVAVPPPYELEQLPALKKIHKEQTTPQRRRAGRTMLAFGLGAGLDGRWAHKVAPNDVYDDDDGVLVRVGYPVPRVIPVLLEWEDEIRDLRDTAEDEFIIGGRRGNRRKASERAKQMEIPPGSPEFSIKRFRSTWIVHHLTIATPLPELYEAAGVLTHRTVSDLVRFVKPRSPQEGRQLLRGVPR